MDLIDKIKAARKINVTVEKYVFTVTRPTDMEMAFLGSQSNEYVFKKYVTGWNVKEIDIIPGGSPVDVDFDPELFYEWISDRPNLWGPIMDAVIDSYKRHVDSRAENEKKPDAG